MSADLAARLRLYAAEFAPVDDDAVEKLRLLLDEAADALSRVSTPPVQEGIQGVTASCTESTDAPAFGAAEDTQRKSEAFEVGCRVRPRGAEIEGTLLEFNEPCTGALIRWDTGEEVSKALRNLEVITSAHPPSGAATVKPCGSEGED